MTFLFSYILSLKHISSSFLTHSLFLYDIWPNLIDIIARSYITTPNWIISEITIKTQTYRSTVLGHRPTLEEERKSWCLFLCVSFMIVFDFFSFFSNSPPAFLSMVYSWLTLPRFATCLPCARLVHCCHCRCNVVDNCNVKLHVRLVLSWENDVSFDDSSSS